ncbi:MAG TPA: hypothetical protein VMU48_05880 [Terracidiphilus sp.]|nr:hypothetical protein [Terracidiphilus sp.]
MSLSGHAPDAAAAKLPGVLAHKILSGDRAGSNSVDPREKTSAISLSGIVEAILEVGRQRKSILEQMRAALLSGDNATALRFARQMCGLPA